jgi:Uma2 family endonuclease
MVTSNQVQEEEEEEYDRQKFIEEMGLINSPWPLDIEEAYKRHRGPYTVQNAWYLLSEEPLELFNGWLVWKHQCHWPRDMEQAYKWISGPYTVQDAWVVLSEEPLELYNGWLVWKPMTNAEERRVATIILVILDLVARTYHFGQAYMDLFECVMANGDELKPDVSIISNQRFESQVGPIMPESKHRIMRGSPELAIEVRSPSNRRTKEREKRQKYFDNGTLVVWDVEPEKHKIWVYEKENPENKQEYGEGDIISCEKIFPGWQRQVDDFFSKELTAEEIVGQAAKEWRAESEAKGIIETLRAMLLRQAHSRFEAEKLPNDLEARLAHFNVEQLTDLVDSISISLTLEEWLNNFPEQP